jgi:hypothetical protein
MPATKKSASSSKGASARGGKSRSSSSAGKSSSSGKSRSSSSSSSSKGRGAASRASSKTTTDHEEIRQWAEERGAKPACVKGTGGKRDTGMIRLDFPGYSGSESLQEISWDEFFEAFDENGLALLYQEKTKGGQKSNFNKLVSRDQSRGGNDRHGRKAR